MEVQMSELESLTKWISQNPESWDIICEAGMEANLNEISDIANSLLDNSLYGVLFMFLCKNSGLLEIGTALKAVFFHTIAEHGNSDIILNMLFDTCKVIDEYRYGKRRVLTVSERNKNRN